MYTDTNKPKKDIELSTGFGTSGLQNCRQNCDANGQLIPAMTPKGAEWFASSAKDEIHAVLLGDLYRRCNLRLNVEYCGRLHLLPLR